MLKTYLFSLLEERHGAAFAALWKEHASRSPAGQEDLKALLLSRFGETYYAAWLDWGRGCGLQG
jgi:hypothetical protein